MLMSTISTTRMIISSIIMNFREETSMGVRMIFYAPHVATRFVNMVLSFDLFPCDLKYFYQSFSETILQPTNHSLHSNIRINDSKTQNILMSVSNYYSFRCKLEKSLRTRDWSTNKLATSSN